MRVLTGFMRRFQILEAGEMKWEQQACGSQTASMLGDMCSQQHTLRR